jgi:hypothetical protein
MPLATPTLLYTIEHRDHNAVGLLLDSRGVDVLKLSNLILVTLSSLNPLNLLYLLF